MRLGLPLILLLLLAALFAGTTPAAAAPAGHTVGQEEWQRLFLETVSQDAPWPAADLVAQRVQAQPASLTLSGRDYAVAVVERTTASRLGKNALTLALLVNGKEEGRVKLTGDLRLYGTVLCAAKKLDRHQLLGADDLTTAKRDLGSLEPGVLRQASEAIGRQLKATLQPGAIIYPTMLASPTLIKRGDRVTIMAQAGGVQVTVPGQARDSGSAGELVRVKNLMSRKEITARVIDSGLVKTEL